MEKYTLMNQFMERFIIGGCRRVRSKEGRFLEEKNFVLKERMWEGGRRRGLIKRYRPNDTTYADAL
jgi:hypothetical protein